MQVISWGKERPAVEGSNETRLGPEPPRGDGGAGEVDPPAPRGRHWSAVSSEPGATRQLRKASSSSRARRARRGATWRRTIGISRRVISSVDDRPLGRHGARTGSAITDAVGEFAARLPALARPVGDVALRASPPCRSSGRAPDRMPGGVAGRRRDRALGEIAVPGEVQVGAAGDDAVGDRAAGCRRGRRGRRRGAAGGGRRRNGSRKASAISRSRTGSSAVGEQA